MTLTKDLRDELKHDLIKKLTKKITEHDFSKKSGNPFIDVIFGKFSNIKSFIHGTATMLGSQYEIMARKIAAANPDFVKAEKITIIGNISSDEKVVIRDIVRDLEESKEGSNYKSEIKRIFNAKTASLGKVKITIDLYLKTKSGKEFFIEMKGHDPNKKEVRAAKEDLLNVVAMKKREIKLKDFDKKFGALFGVYYNNKEGPYENWKVSPLFEKGEGLLVQEDFWDFLGGDGTYNDILGIVSEIKEIIYPLIKKKIDLI